MTKLEQQRFIIQSAIEGKRLQFRSKAPPTDQWADIVHPVPPTWGFQFVDYEYRIRPEPREGWTGLAPDERIGYPTKEELMSKLTVGSPYRPVFIREVLDPKL